MRSPAIFRLGPLGVSSNMADVKVGLSYISEVVGCGGGVWSLRGLYLTVKKIYSSIASRQPVVEPELYTAVK